MKKYSLVVVVMLLWVVAPVRAADEFTGTWNTTFGVLTMNQKGSKVTGSYYEGKASLEGVAEKNKLVFTYLEKGEKGEGEFNLAADGKSFVGKYRIIGAKKWIEWKGSRK